MITKTVISSREAMELHLRLDANLLLTKAAGTGTNFDVAVIKFQSRQALEAFNRKANLFAVVKTKVPKGCAIYRHEVEE